MLDRDEVRRCADMVQVGECIEFPNGLVIDKRPLPAPYQHTDHLGRSIYPSIPNGYTGYRCSSCGQWVTLGQAHSCTTVGLRD